MIKLNYELKDGIDKSGIDFVDVRDTERILSLLSSMRGETLTLGGDTAIKFHYRNRLYILDGIRRFGNTIQLLASEKILDGGKTSLRQSVFNVDDEKDLVKAVRSVAYAFNASLLKEKHRRGVCTERCSHCEQEVQIRITFKRKQVCPSCGEQIMPCNICDMDKIDCRYCPLK